MSSGSASGGLVAVSGKTKPYKAAPKGTATITQILHVAMSYIVLGTDGGLYQSQVITLDWYYNHLGYGYPNYAPYNSYVPFWVFFPPPPYDVCPDGSTPTCPRDFHFKDKLVNYYQQQGWLIPRTAQCGNQQVEAHHIKPLEFGGGNDMTNGVLLCKGDHPYFTNWWYSFTPS